MLGSSHSILPQSDNGGTIVGYTRATSILTYLQRSEYSHIHNGTSTSMVLRAKIVFQIFLLKIAMQGETKAASEFVRANTCNIGNVSTNIAYKCLKNNRGTYHRIETTPKDCKGQVGTMVYLFLSTTLNLLIIFLGAARAGFLFTPESADFSDKSLIHYVQNGSAPAEALALANMSRQFKMKTNSGTKSCFLKIQHIDQVCSNLSGTRIGRIL